MLLALLACSAPPALSPGTSPPQGVTVTVLAASSLTESLATVARDWEGESGNTVVLSFDATSKLAKQVVSGAPRDLFFSADSAWMDHLEQRGLVATGTRVDLLGNTLVTVVPRGTVSPPVAARDLARVERLALAGENVPAGKYARAALRAGGDWAALAPRVVVAENVRAALTWVARGEADAGVVYATDARVEPGVEVAFTFPAGTHPPVVYPAAVLAGALEPATAGAFLAYCQAPEAARTFAAAGFLPAPP